MKEEISNKIDNFINKLLSITKQDKKKKELVLLEEDVILILDSVMEIIEKQPIFLNLNGPVKIIGDIHGQFFDLLRIFELVGYPPNFNFLFLGDYVDRGKNSIETICLLYLYKIKYPENFFLLRGNHESASINRMYGFYDECKRKYNVKIWKKFTFTFNFLPVTALVEEKIFCMHGGLSPSLKNINIINKIVRPTDIPEFGLLCDILWSDPNPATKGWNENERGVSYVFGNDVINNFINFNDIELICRAHQVVEDGYEFINKKRLVTIFSAPNYCGEFDNKAAIINVSQDLTCSFSILKPKKSKKEVKKKNIKFKNKTPPKKLK